MKNPSVKEVLRNNVSNFTSSKGPTYTFKQSYFYRHGDEYSFANNIIKQIKTLMPHNSVNLIDAGDHWHAFVGGAKSGSAQDSYLYAKIEIAPGIVVQPPEVAQNVNQTP